MGDMPDEKSPEKEAPQEANQNSKGETPLPKQDPAVKFRAGPLLTVLLLGYGATGLGYLANT